MTSLIRRALSSCAVLSIAAAMPPALLAKPADAGKTAQTADPLKGIALDIPATRMVLPNGLTLIVHEDHSAPLVAVSVWYHVGSKNEPKSKTGFAHLFEHLMFNGSENFNDDFFKATQKIGASQQNGTTNADRTNYFETVPKGALDTILWLESDRMGHLLGAVDQGRLDEQRAVVKNEKRQGQNQPYAKASDLIIHVTEPAGHPYDHSTIGSMADLDAASLDDVKDWFRTYYGPSNAVLVLSGDITPAEARARVEKYFGDIAPGQPVAHPGAWVAKMTGTIRETAYDRVAQPRLIMTWNVPGYGTPDAAHLDVLGELLSGDRNSRLYKRLIIDDQLATSVSAGVDAQEIQGQFQIDVMLKPGVDTARAERIVNEEMARLIDQGATAAELARIRIRQQAALARDMESIARKGMLLAESQLYLGSPDAWKADLDRHVAATSADVQRAGKTWLSDGVYVLDMLPFGDLRASAAGADRKTMPMPASIAVGTFPSVERATLANGMKLVVAHRGGAPLVTVQMDIDTGIAADYAEVPPGLASLAVSLLDEGTRTRTASQISDDLAALGAALSANGDNESAEIGLSLLKPTLGKALPIFADIAMNPAYRPADVERYKAEATAGIRSARQSPTGISRRLASRLVFGKGFAYGRLATEATIASIDRDKLEAFHARWFHPNNATLIVAGDTSMAEIRPLIETAFAGWRPAPVPAITQPLATPPEKAVVYLVDTPGAPQSVVNAAFVAPPRSDGDELARRVFNAAFGGTFTSRVNMKLREEKGWSYGAHSIVGSSRGSRLLTVGGPVQSDRTADAMHEIDLLLKKAVGDQPIDAQELANAKDNLVLGLSSAWATGGGIANYLADQSAYRLPDDYYARYPAAIEGETLDAVNAAGKALIAGRPITWIVVGDRAKIEEKVRALGLGELRIVDADGNPVP